MRTGAPALPSPRPGRWRRAALAVFRKEMTETLRDRRLLAAAVLLPALTIPLVVLVMPTLLQRQQQALREQPVRVAALGEEALRLAEVGKAQGAFRVLSSADPEGALLRGELDAVLTSEALPARAQRVVVRFDGSRPASAAAANRAADLAARLSLRHLAALAAERGPEPSVWIPVVEPRNVASPERMGGALLATALPLFLAVWILLGGQYAALDAGVGERERGSLEPLLATPPARSALVAGKFLAVLAPSVLALVVMLITTVLSLAFGVPLLMAESARVVLPAGVALVLMGVGVALAGLLSAVQLAISLGARTLREAQQAFAGLYVIVAVPTLMAPAAGDFLEGPWVSLVPVVNAAWAIQRLLATGEASSSLVTTILMLVVWTGPVLELTSRALERSGRLNR